VNQTRSKTQANVKQNPSRASRCNAHLHPSLWQGVPVPKRPGWLRFECRACGGFIGYGPAA